MKEVYDDNSRKAFLSIGTIHQNVHHSDWCWNQKCPLHNPREHEYSHLPLDWKNGSFIRLSNDFEYGFTIDPDDYDYNRGIEIIFRNSAECLKCDDSLVSENYQTPNICQCGNVKISGSRVRIDHQVKDKTQYHNSSICFKKTLE